MNLVELAQRIKAARLERGMTLEELSESSGLGKGLLSKVENFRVMPTLLTLSKLTEALGIRFSDLLDGLNERPSISVVRRGERKPIERNQAHPSPDHPFNNYYESLVHQRTDRAMDPFCIRVPANGGRQEALRHEGEEFMLVLEGEVMFFYHGEVVRLEEGDSVYFDAGKDHRLFNESAREARVLSVMCFGTGKR